jgi:16S rRNA (guanine966-N2)-methyltransferase
LRVIAGIARGRKLKAPKGVNTRPTTDKIKESMFNIIQANIEGRDVLDLFAGTGALGIEAISRGASSAIFVDSDIYACKTIIENLTALGFDINAVVMRKDILLALKALSKESKSFDLIFMDPPYGSGLELSTLLDLVKFNIIREGGIIVIEHSSKDALPQNVGPVKQLKEREYGTTKLTFYMS